MKKRRCINLPRKFFNIKPRNDGQGSNSVGEPVSEETSEPQEHFSSPGFREAGKNTKTQEQNVDNIDIHRVEVKFQQAEQNQLSEQPSAHQSHSRILIEWKAPAWVFEKTDLSALKNFSIPVLVFFLISIFFKWFFLALSGLALIFLYLVLGKVEPQTVKHKISENGITTAGHTYIWSQLKDFFFTQRKNQTILSIDTNIGFPGRLFLVLQGVDQEKVQETLLRFLPMKETGREDLWDKVVNKMMSWMVIRGSDKNG